MKRITILLLIAVATLPLTPAVSPAAASAPRAPAVLALDLPSLLFGDENEPDENEPDDGDSGARPAKHAPRHHRKTVLGVPLDVLLPVLGVLVLLGAITAIVVRWVRKYRAWKRRMAFRARVGIRRLADDLERVRRRGFGP